MNTFSDFMLKEFVSPFQYVALVTPHSQNGPGALPGACPHRYGLLWETIEVPAKALKIEKR